MHIIMFGSPADGWKFQGPFEFYDEAKEFAAKVPGTAYIVPLQRPEGYVFGAHNLDTGEDDPEPELPHNPWIEWKGGPCPVPPYTIVQVQYSGGHRSSRHKPAHEVDWLANISVMNVIAYRVIRY
jgi:hypothetical protein